MALLLSPSCPPTPSSFTSFSASTLQASGTSLSAAAKSQAVSFGLSFLHLERSNSNAASTRSCGHPKRPRNNHDNTGSPTSHPTRCNPKYLPRRRKAIRRKKDYRQRDSTHNFDPIVLQELREVLENSLPHTSELFFDCAQFNPLNRKKGQQPQFQHHVSNSTTNSATAEAAEVYTIPKTFFCDSGSTAATTARTSLCPNEAINQAGPLSTTSGIGLGNYDLESSPAKMPRTFQMYRPAVPLSLPVHGPVEAATRSTAPSHSNSPIPPATANNSRSATPVRGYRHLHSSSQHDTSTRTSKPREFKRSSSTPPLLSRFMRQNKHSADQGIKKSVSAARLYGDDGVASTETILYSNESAILGGCSETYIGSSNETSNGISTGMVATNDNLSQQLLRPQPSRQRPLTPTNGSTGGSRSRDSSRPGRFPAGTHRSHASSPSVSLGGKPWTSSSIHNHKHSHKQDMTKEEFEALPVAIRRKVCIMQNF